MQNEKPLKLFLLSKNHTLFKICTKFENNPNFCKTFIYFSKSQFIKIGSVAQEWTLKAFQMEWTRISLSKFHCNKRYVLYTHTKKNPNQIDSRRKLISNLAVTYSNLVNIIYVVIRHDYLFSNVVYPVCWEVCGSNANIFSKYRVFLSFTMRQYLHTFITGRICVSDMHMQGIFPLLLGAGNQGIEWNAYSYNLFC